MKISHKYLLVPGALIAFLAAFPVETFCQAFVLGKNPSFTALNLRNKKALDDVLLEVRYLFTWSKFHDSSQPHTEQRTILVGRNTIYSRNEALYQNDSVATSLMAKGAKGVALYSNPTVPYEVWTNRETKNTEISYRVPFDNMVISFAFPSNIIQWSINEDEKQVVLGYACSKATTLYRGRTVTAWFSEDLPYDAGPYCFTGLPGLIMKIELEDLSWEAIGIKKGRDGEQIYTYARPRQQMSREKAINFLINLYNDPVATYSTLGVECYSAENTSKILVSGSLKWEIPSIIKLEQ